MRLTEVVLKDSRRCVLRPVRRGDTVRIYDYFLHLSPTSRNFFHPHPFTLEEARRIAEDCGSATNRRILALDPHTDRVAGYVFYETLTLTGGYPILGIGLADEFQGVGLGRMMMLAALEEARLSHRQGMDLTVYKDNVRALALYRSLGFEVTGETDDGKQYTMRLLLTREEPPAR